MLNCNSIWGWRSWKRAILGSSQYIITEAEQDRVRGPGWSCSMLACIRLKAADSPSARRKPSGVGSVDWVPRLSRRTPRVSSRALICRLTAPWVTNSSSAARVMLRRRAVASKARRAFRDGRGVRIVFPPGLQQQKPRPDGPRGLPKLARSAAPPSSGLVSFSHKCRPISRLLRRLARTRFPSNKSTTAWRHPRAAAVNPRRRLLELSPTGRTSAPDRMQTRPPGGDAMAAAAVSPVENSTIRKVSIRLVPFIALMFFINFLDRTAISFAGPNGLAKDLGLTAAQFGFAAGIFFFGYILLEIPSNLALHRFGARRWLARIMVTWGIVALLFTWVSSVEGLYTLRFLLGIAEAGFFPGAILFLSLWVPARHRSRILALFYLAQPLTIVIGAPLAAGLIEAHGLFGLEGWRIMFFGVAVPAILVGVIAWFYLADKPVEAKWLDADEKRWLTAELAKEEQVKTHAHSPLARKALGNGRVWMLSLIYFGLIYGLYALAFFLPTIIGGFEAQFGSKFNVFQKGLITAIPYLPAAVALYLWSRDATRRGVRAWHVGLPALAGAVSIPLALYMQSPATTVAAITVTACAIFSALPNFWAIPARFLSGAATAAGIALINTIGNLAGFAAPYITGALKDATGSYQAPMFLVGGFMLLSAILVFVMAARERPQAASEEDFEALEPQPAIKWATK